MKEGNKPEQQQPEQPVVIQKPKPERKYIALSNEELHNKINKYRECLKDETDGEFRDQLMNKIVGLERELKLRSKLQSK